MAVQSGSMSLREAARKYDIPRTTLQRRVQHRVKCRVSETSSCTALEPMVVKQAKFSHAVADTHARSDTSSEETTVKNETEHREVNKIGHKRSASHLATHDQGWEQLLIYI